MKRNNYWIQAAIIAGIYAALTLVLAPISYGFMQVRVSEMLTILPFFTPAAIPGLFMGCLISNIISPYGLPDLIFGSLASLISAICSYYLRKYPLLVPLPPVVLNGIIIGSMLYFVYGIDIGLIPCILWVGLGQFLSCYLLGYPFMRYMKRHKGLFDLN